MKNTKIVIGDFWIRLSPTGLISFGRRSLGKHDRHVTVNLQPRDGRVTPHLTERFPGARRKKYDFLADWDFEEIVHVVQRLRRDLVARFFASVGPTSMEEVLDYRCRLLDATEAQWKEIVATFVRQRGRGTYSIPLSQFRPEKFEELLGPCFREIRKSDESLLRKRAQPILVPDEDGGFPLLLMWLERPPILEATPGLYVAPMDGDAAQIVLEVLFRQSGDAMFDFVGRILNHLDLDAEGGLLSLREKLTDGVVNPEALAAPR